AEVIYTIREEMASSLRDFFARRTRMELMDWKASFDAIHTVADLMANELGWTENQKNINILNYQTLLKTFMRVAFNK
ncbi:MAG: glycerol-3-phosphate dehydrogenase C-terminal domain-containing protein, partial [Emticicia sp.]|uniref:glycerol-3-phosphate dehydrogenase C-terminal domain-containing protein n=1 Tax=Emticicia sp. TaxID=1930953 RepID=UPI003BA7FFC4